MNKNVLTHTGGGGSRLTGKSHVTGSPQAQLRGPVDPGFTMAEILLSLTIIGVVAAITLPSLTGNINERTWNTQRKALYARFSQALALMPSLNSYGTLSAEQTDSSTGSVTQSAVDTATETFLTEGLSKVLKINNICDSEHLADCGIASNIIPLTGSIISLDNIKTLHGFNSLFTSGTGIPLDTKAAAFETQNGESILVYYNPNCAPNLNETGGHYIQPKMCVNFVYDLNGNKGPNTVSKDIGFITALYPTDPMVVAPMPLATGTSKGSNQSAGEACKAQESESRVPNREELISMFYNRNLIGITTGDYDASVLSSTKNYQGNNTWYLDFTNGNMRIYMQSGSYRLRCIKR